MSGFSDLRHWWSSGEWWLADHKRGNTPITCWHVFVFCSSTLQVSARQPSMWPQSCSRVLAVKGEVFPATTWDRCSGGQGQVHGEKTGIPLKPDATAGECVLLVRGTWKQRGWRNFLKLKCFFQKWELLTSVGKVVCLDAVIWFHHFYLSSHAVLTTNQSSGFVWDINSSYYWQYIGHMYVRCLYTCIVYGQITINQPTFSVINMLSLVVFNLCTKTTLAICGLGSYWWLINQKLRNCLSNTWPPLQPQFLKLNRWIASALLLSNSPNLD